MRRLKRLLNLLAIPALFLFVPSFVTEVHAAAYKKAVYEKKGSSYNVDVQYPQITDKRIAPEVRQKLNDEIESYVHGLFDGDLKAFLENESEWTEEDLKGIAGRDLVAITFQVVRLDRKFVSIKFEKYTYGIGAVHGFNKRFGFNYDLRRQDRVALADLFESGTDYLNEVSARCIENLAKQLKRNPDDWMREGASASEDKLKEFTIGKKKLTVYFSDYQVAEYAAGTMEAVIPYSKLSGMKRDFSKSP